jgi:hypothetical protein
MHCPAFGASLRCVRSRHTSARPGPAARLRSTLLVGTAATFHEVRLGAAGMDGESGDDFIEDQQAAVVS